MEGFCSLKTRVFRSMRTKAPRSVQGHPSLGRAEKGEEDLRRALVLRERATKKPKRETFRLAPLGNLPWFMVCLWSDQRSPPMVSGCIGKV